MSHDPDCLMPYDPLEPCTCALLAGRPRRSPIIVSRKDYTAVPVVSDVEDWVVEGVDGVDQHWHKDYLNPRNSKITVVTTRRDLHRAMKL